MKPRKKLAAKTVTQCSFIGFFSIYSQIPGYTTAVSIRKFLSAYSFPFGII